MQWKEPSSVQKSQENIEPSPRWKDLKVYNLKTGNEETK